MQGGCQVSKALNRQKMKNGEKGNNSFSVKSLKKVKGVKKVKKIFSGALNDKKPQNC
jgi:hypothetical protein